MQNKIIVHAGDAHLDEFIACAEALVARSWDWDYEGETLEKVAADTVIERRDPVHDELEDPEVLVLDVGGRLDADDFDFDHHQLPRGTRECAMTLFAKGVTVPCGVVGAPEDSLYAAMARLYPWYETRAAVDAVGPFAVAKEKGVEWSAVASFLGPFEDIVLGQFKDATPENRAQVVLPFTKDILAKIEAERAVLDHVRYPAVDGCVEIIDFTEADPAKTEIVSGAILGKYDRGVAIFHDNRGDGLALLRLNDDSRVDFSRVKDDPSVAFAHVGGFIAKTKTKDVEDAFRLVRLAVKEAS